MNLLVVTKSLLVVVRFFAKATHVAPLPSELILVSRAALLNASQKVRQVAYKDASPVMMGRKVAWGKICQHWPTFKDMYLRNIPQYYDILCVVPYLRSHSNCLAHRY